MAGLKLQAVSKSWDGKTQVIQPLTLDVADGEFIVMVGPSGCGKSTLLRMVAGLERVTSGDIWIDRKRVTEMEPGGIPVRRTAVKPRRQAARADASGTAAAASPPENHLAVRHP